MHILYIDIKNDESVNSNEIMQDIAKYFYLEIKQKSIYESIHPITILHMLSIMRTILVDIFVVNEVPHTILKIKREFCEDQRNVYSKEYK